MDNGLIEYIPVVTSGTFVCEHKDCETQQTDDDKNDILFYGKDNGMFCKKHLAEHSETVSI